MLFIGGTFRNYVTKVKYLQITDDNMVKWKKKVKKCSVVILYHSRREGQVNITDVDGALYEEELRSISHTLGKNKVLVVLDDLEDWSEFEKQRILSRQPSLRRLSSQLLLFPKRDKIAEANRKTAEFLKAFGKYTATEEFHVNSPVSGFQESGGMFSESRENFPRKEDIKQPVERNLKISVFSRSAPSNYEWLVNWLKTTCMVGPDNIRRVCISNNSIRFYTELPNCTFAILYHTLKQGALNISDSSSSLYDEELKELYQHLGKENVIVVVDDLPKTNSTEKKQILATQPSIGKLAGDLYLINEKKNNMETLENLKKAIMQGPQSEEFLEPDPEDDFEEPSNASTVYPHENIYMDSNENIRPTSSRRSSTKFSKEYDSSAARISTWKSSDYSEGLKPETVYLEPTLWSHHRSIQRQQSEEFLESDPVDDLEEPSNTSTMYPCENIYMDSDEDIRPTSSRRSSRKFSNEYDSSAARTSNWRSSDYSEGLKTGTMYPERTLWSHPRSIQRQQSEEFLEPDDPEPHFEESSNTSTMYPRENIYMDSNEDIEPTSSRRSLTQFSNEYDSSAAHILTWKSSDHSEGLRTGTVYPEPTIWSHRRSMRMDISRQDELAGASSHSNNYMQEIEEFRDLRRPPTPHSENQGLRHNRPRFLSEESGEEDTQDQVLVGRGMMEQLIEELRRKLNEKK
ncbi:uncharacterized protein RB166_016643 isoform 2-T2 [Leptodactylus fuscus]